MLAAIVATQIQMMVLGLCMDGAKATCTIAGCSKAQKICMGGYWDPCTCIGGPTPCNDGNACTVNDVIGNSGQCAGTPVNVNDGNPCTVDSCNTSTGVISHVQLPAGSSCSDGNPCTVSDVCDSSGRCAGTPAIIDDGNPCTVDACSPTTGVVSHTPSPGIACSDGNACTVADTCDAAGRCVGTAVPIDDGKPCTLDSCNAATGVVSHVLTAGLPCNDGNACTTGDVCNAAGGCAGTPVAVDDGNPCTFDRCDPASGAITHPLASPGDATCSSASFYCYDKYGNVTKKAVCVAGSPCSASCP